MLFFADVLFAIMAAGLNIGNNNNNADISIDCDFISYSCDTENIVMDIIVSGHYYYYH